MKGFSSTNSDEKNIACSSVARNLWRKIKGFDALQESNRTSSIKVSDHKKVELLINSVEMIPTIQEELIKMITNDNNLRERVLKDIMDELGIENPNKKKKKDKKFSSMSFDDWFNDD